MNSHKLIPSIIEAAIAGLAFAFILVLLLRPESFDSRPEVLFLEAPIDENRAAATQGIASYAYAVEQTAPSVVNIYATKIVTQRTNPLFSDPTFRRFFGDRLPAPRQRLENSLGSGVIINTQGYLLTNNHVVQGAAEIKVALQDGRTTDARVIGTDPETDLAILKIELSDLPTILLGHSNRLKVGDVVLAIGNPFGVGQTVTSGIISATGRSHLGISTFENFIQTDAAINPGNSGGALINSRGELIGINTAIYSRSGGSQGIGFAIPVDLAKGVMQQIIEYGRPIRGWLGITAQDLSPELAESFGLSSTAGAIIANVQPKGPAALAGLRRGDIITQLNGTTVTDVKQLMNTIAGNLPGTQLQIQVLRNGHELTFEAEISERPQPRQAG